MNGHRTAGWKAVQKVEGSVKSLFLPPPEAVPPTVLPPLPWASMYMEAKKCVYMKCRVVEHTTG